MTTRVTESGIHHFATQAEIASISEQNVMIVSVESDRPPSWSLDVSETGESTKCLCKTVCFGLYIDKTCVPDIFSESPLTGNSYGHPDTCNTDTMHIWHVPVVSVLAGFHSIVSCTIVQMYVELIIEMQFCFLYCFRLPFRSLVRR